MDNEKPLAQGKYLLQKFPGKGGWTYAEIPEIQPNKNNPFGWETVKGHIDTFELKQFKLMPMGNGELFLPVKAEIRKKIKKQAGDWVTITLHIDRSKVEIPATIMECFQNEPKEVLQNFLAFSEGQQKAYLDWIAQAKTEATQAQRIVEMMDRTIQKKGFYE